MITYNAEGIAMPKIKKRLTSKWIRAVAASHGRKVGEVGYLFVNDDKILEVNREYLGHDYYTDIITFDYDVPVMPVSSACTAACGKFCYSLQIS